MKSETRLASEYVPRVDQYDAQELDGEIFTIWKGQVLNIFKYLTPGFISRFEPELNALLRLLIWKISVKAYHATVGQQLLLIKYKDDSRYFRWKLGLYAVGIVGCRWLDDRLDYLNILVGKGWSNKRHLHRILDWGELVLRMASFVNFLVFLYQGKYLTLIERLLRMEKVPTVPHGARQLDFDYMIRELMWHGCAEFITFLLPYINWQKLKKWRRKRSTSISHAIEACDASSAAFCGICEQSLRAPQVIGCRHVFCHYCIMSHFLTEECNCPVCGRPSSIESIRNL